MRAVLFDLDGVITDSAEYHYQAWKLLAQDIGINIDRNFNEQLKGVSRTDSLERILQHGHKSTQYTQVEKNQLAEQKNAVYLEMIKQITPKDLLPGIAQLLMELRNDEQKIVLCSASRNGPEILERLGISSMFDVIVDPASLKAGKPAPDVFLKGAELVNVSPCDCVGIEDAHSGVTAIKNAGMVAIAIGDRTQLGHADCVLTSTAELSLTLLKSIWQQHKK